MSIVPKVKLSNGLKMPAIGFGTFSILEDICIKTVKYAIDKGYRHFDTAMAYKNEREVGEAVRQKISEGVVKREDIFLTTKLWCIHHEPSKVEHACRESLKKLGLDYIDLYLMHFPVGFIYIDDDTHRPKKNETDTVVITNDVDYIDTWKAMEKLVDKGLVRSIGISNFNREQTERLLKHCTIKPVVNQVECHIELNQKKLIEFSKKHEIYIVAYSPLARPNAAEKKPAFMYDERVKAIAAKYQKTLAQIALKFTVQFGAISIPKSVNKSRIDENIQIFDFELTPDEMKTLEGMNTNNRIGNWNFVDETHKYYPFNAEF